MVQPDRLAAEYLRRYMQVDRLIRSFDEAFSRQGRGDLAEGRVHDVARDAQGSQGQGYKRPPDLDARHVQRHDHLARDAGRLPLLHHTDVPVPAASGKSLLSGNHVSNMSTTALPRIAAAQNWNLRTNENFVSAVPVGPLRHQPGDYDRLTLGYLGGNFGVVAPPTGTVLLTASTTKARAPARRSGEASRRRA